jgi:hypothetical protein
LAAPLLFKAESRLQAYSTAFFYYLAASWPIIPGAKAFLRVHGATLDAILLCVAAVTALSIPAAVLFTRDRQKLPFAITGMFVCAALPPLGIIGWASPFLSAGVLFPGTHWFGLAAILLILPLLARFPLPGAILVALIAFLANAFYTAPALPIGWVGVNTEFGGAGQADVDFLSDFDAQEQMQETITRSNARLLLFPEHVVTHWNEATEAFWHNSLEHLAQRQATVLIGAGLQRQGGQQFFGGRRYYNVLIATGKERRRIYYQRIPVPLGMWKPLSDDGVPLNLFGTGTIPIENHPAAVHPTALITTANNYWAKRTPIPRIQRACAASDARLFRIPLLSAFNCSKAELTNGQTNSCS